MSDLRLDEFYFDQNSVIREELSKIDLSGLTEGKHLRSRLTALIGNIFNINEIKITKLGRVVELVHNATLTHDDVIDNSHTRRENPSIPALINNKKSVLLGDYMLAKSLHELSEFENPKLTAELTLTLKDLVEGEWIQYENTNPYEVTQSIYELLAVKKTGSLFRWCFVAPLVASEQNQNIYDDFCDLGETLGIIFQISDDIIDFNKESKKTYGLDFRNNNLNFVLHYIGVDYPELKKKFLQAETLEELSSDEFKTIELSVTKAKQHIKGKIERCHGIIEKIKGKLSGESKASLDELITILDFLEARVF